MPADPELSDAEVRVLSAVAASGSSGTGAETIAVRTNLDKSTVLGHLTSMWDRGLVEQVSGMRGVYRVSDEGKRRLP